MLADYLRALSLIFIAEMGDKTQILAMAFASQFSARCVLSGVAIGSFMNHAIAVALGSYFSTRLPMGTVQIIAGFLFIGFALWSLKTEDDEEDSNECRFYGPVLTVAMAFFIGELGDKTQLTAMTLAADSAFPMVTLLGTVSGMIITSALGVLAGNKIASKVSKTSIKIGSAIIFLAVGAHKLYTNLPTRHLNATTIALFLTITLGLFTYLLIQLRKNPDPQTPPSTNYSD